MALDWMWGCLKGAAIRGGPASEAAWAKVEASLGRAPEELRALYTEADGASLNGGVHLLPLGSPRGVLAESQIVGFVPARRAWRFGTVGKDWLFAARAADVSPASEAGTPDWVKGLAQDTWVYGRFSGKGKTRFYRSLEAMLAVLVPPTDTEEFGEATFTRALNAVEKAVVALKANEGAGKGKGGKAGGRKATAKKAR